MLIPVKSFEVAKGRLADAVSPDERSRLARHMAANVIRAAQDLPVWVVCDDSAVAEFAIGQGAGIIWRASRGLNRAVADGTQFLANTGFGRVIVAHADLPLATDLRWLADTSWTTSPSSMTIVPDRHGDGSNVMSLPSSCGFNFAYGVGSAGAHRAEAERLGLAIRMVPDEQLGWDVDTVDDLAAIDNALLPDHYAATETPS